MTWLYVPGISSAFAPASEDSNSASCSASLVGERLAAGSATWRGKEQPPQAWSRRWKQGGFIRLLSGPTCSPSTLDRGVASFISSLRATPAKTTASPESALEPRAIASSPPRSSVSPTSAGLILSSEKTCRGTLASSLQPSSRHWSDWATALRQEYSVRPKPAIPCAASDCSSWPSARTSDTNGAGTHGDGGPDLRTVAVNWPSPMAGAAGTEDYNAAGNSDFSRKAMEMADALISQWESPSVAVTDGTRMTRGGDRSDELLLTGQASATAAAWSSPTCRIHKGSGPTVERSDGKIRDDQLDYQAEQFFRLPSSPGHPTPDGLTFSPTIQNSSPPSVKRKLNPLFVEALMRWPTGLSGFERPETAWIQWWQQQLFYVSALCSPKEQAQGSLF